MELSVPAQTFPIWSILVQEVVYEPATHHHHVHKWTNTIKLNVELP
jgi:hypothetical protein